MTWRALLFSFEARRFHPNRAETDPTALMCMCRHMCLFKYTHYEGDIFFFSFIPSHLHSGCVESQQRRLGLCGVHWESRLESFGGGAYERLLRQRERLVSSNSQDKNCWLMKEIIYSEAMGKLKSSAPFRGMTSKMRHLKSQNRRS